MFFQSNYSFYIVDLRAFKACKCKKTPTALVEIDKHTICYSRSNYGSEQLPLLTRLDLQSKKETIRFYYKNKKTNTY